jgi:putative membrane protein
MIKDFIDNQGKSERIKNFPYPRQFATINTFFIKTVLLFIAVWYA